MFMIDKWNLMKRWNHGKVDTHQLKFQCQIPSFWLLFHQVMTHYVFVLYLAPLHIFDISLMRWFCTFVSARFALRSWPGNLSKNQKSYSLIFADALCKIWPALIQRPFNCLCSSYSNTPLIRLFTALICPHWWDNLKVLCQGNFCLISDVDDTWRLFHSGMFPRNLCACVCLKIKAPP